MVVYSLSTLLYSIEFQGPKCKLRANSEIIGIKNLKITKDL